MGGCSASKLLDHDYNGSDVVSLCRERKRLLKSAIDRRYALADSHCKYIQSLYDVAAAIHLFVARYTSPASPFLITLPSPIPSPPLPSFPNHSLPSHSSDSTQLPHIGISRCSSSSSSSADGGEVEEVGTEKQEEVAEEGKEEEEEEEEEVMEEEYGYAYGSTGMASPPMPSPMKDFGWDFFNPFEGVRGDSAVAPMMMMGGLSTSSDEDLRVVREEEGIPELEEEEDRERRVVMPAEEGKSGVEVVKSVSGEGSGKMGKLQHQHNGLTVIDTPTRERELMEALKDVEDHFIRAYDSGKDVSRMLEANRFRLQSGLEEIKENSSKFIQAVTWHRSTSSQSSSHKSYFASGSKDDIWKEYNNELFEEYGGMESGSHSLTLGRLYAWEKKLYDEVKAGDSTRRTYERKCVQLRNQEARGDDPKAGEKTGAAVKDLYTRIWVSIRSVDSISKRIEKLRDEELHPQLAELLKGLMKTWKVMLESHETQNKIMFEVKSFTSSLYGRFCSDVHRHATLQLEAELHNWCECFTSYIAAQRAYVQALDGWLSKFIVPDIEFCPRACSTVQPYLAGAPPLIMICHDWLNRLNKLEDRSVVHSMKSFCKDVRVLWVHQGEEQQQKRKVDNLAKELDRRAKAFQRAENRILESELPDLKAETDTRQRMEYLSGRKDLLDMFRTKLDLEQAKHHNCIQETQLMTLSSLQAGFTCVFESLTEFCKASLSMYKELVMFNEKAGVMGR